MTQMNLLGCTKKEFKNHIIKNYKNNIFYMLINKIIFVKVQYQY